MFKNLIAAMNTTSWVMIALLAVMVVVLIVLPMFTNKRRNKAVTDLHNSLRAGDVVKTVGGIVGTIIRIDDISPVDKQMVIETGVGDNKATLVFDVQAVYQVISKTSAPAPEMPVENEVKPVTEELAQPEITANVTEDAHASEIVSDGTSSSTDETAAAKTESSEVKPVAKKPAAKKAGSSQK